MPLYDYQCRKCEKIYEAFNSYEKRAKNKCRFCGGVSDMLPPAPSIHLFEPFDLDVGPMDTVRVEDKKQLKRACKKYGKYAPGYDILEHPKEV